MARCTVAQLMTEMDLAGGVRGKPVKTTAGNPDTPCPKDRVNRRFNAPRPKALWLSDFTSVATWAGFVHVAFVIHASAGRVVGWRVSRSMQAEFVLDTLDQALHDRRPARSDGLIHHSDHGVQCLAIKYTERLAEAGIELCEGSVLDVAFGEFHATASHGPRRTSSKIRKPLNTITSTVEEANRAGNAVFGHTTIW